MKFFIKLIKKVVFILIFSGFLAFSIFVYYLWKLNPELPSYSDIENYNPKLTSRVFTSDGLLLEKYYIQERIFVPIDRIPQNLINAFISSEDKNFYSHYGIDIIAIIRATLTNIINQFTNRKMIGASTITQQVVKNLLLSNEISLERKFKEIILAIRIENILSKNKILELYLNDIYLGFGSYGVATASMNYFNKSLKELNLQESAFLAALPKAPNNYNPKKKYKNAIQRRNWVLRKMYKNKYISFTDLQYSKEPLLVIDRYEDKFEEADLNIKTLRVNDHKSPNDNINVYLRKYDPTETEVKKRRSFISCVVCGQSASYNRTNVQNHQTSGDQPFHVLVSNQLKIQPPNKNDKMDIDFSPNEGRKVLVVSVRGQPTT